MPAVLLCVLTVIGLYAARQLTPEPVALTDDALDRLRALGYLTHTTYAADASQVGVVRHDRARAWPGYNWYDCVLMDMDGHTVWQPDFGGYCVLTKDGEVYRMRTEESVVSRHRWDGVERWGLEMGVHHELSLGPDGTIYILSTEVHEYKKRSVEFDVIVQLSADGEPLSRWSSWEHLEKLQRHHPPSRLDRKPHVQLVKLPSAKGLESEAGGDYDYYHLNSIQVLPETPLSGDPRFRPGNLLVSSNHADLLFIIDSESGGVVWSWGPGDVEGPHMPRMLPGGTILVFDNGREHKRGHTRILELDPVANRIVWSYVADPPESFFSSKLGSAQRLPNGNTLVGDSENGRAFEITRAGDIVWEWFDSDFNEDGQRSLFYRMERYDPEWIEPWLLPSKAAGVEEPAGKHPPSP